MCERLERDGAVWVCVCGPCMEPQVMRGAWEPAERPQEWRVGDVVLVHCPSKDVAHRLVARIRAGPRVWWIHMGDAARVPGLASERDLCLRLVRPARRVRRTPAASLLWVVGQLGAQLAHAGIPSPPGARRVWAAVRRFMSAAAG